MTVLLKVAVRKIFAWASDRIVPTKLADANKRFSSSIKASIVLLGLHLQQRDHRHAPRVVWLPTSMLLLIWWRKAPYELLSLLKEQQLFILPVEGIGLLITLTINADNLNIQP